MYANLAVKLVKPFAIKVWTDLMYNSYSLIARWVAEMELEMSRIVILGRKNTIGIE